MKEPRRVSEDTIRQLQYFELVDDLQDLYEDLLENMEYYSAGRLKEVLEKYQENSF